MGQERSKGQQNLGTDEVEERELGDTGLGTDGMAGRNKGLAGYNPRQKNEDDWTFSGLAGSGEREARRQYGWGNGDAGTEEQLLVERG